MTNMEVALKIIPKNRLKQGENMSKIKREIKLLKKLSHPNIIKLLNILDTTSDMYVVTELIEGGELFELIQQKGRYLTYLDSKNPKPGTSSSRLSLESNTCIRTKLHTETSNPKIFYCKRILSKSRISA